MGEFVVKLKNAGLAVVLWTAASAATHAAPVTIQAPDVLVAGGAGTLLRSAELLATTAPDGAGTGVNTTLPNLGTYNYGHSFDTNLAPLTGAPAYDFIDAYVFNVAGSVASNVTTTIDLGSAFVIDGLEVRLYGANVGDIIPLTGSAPGQTFIAATTLQPGMETAVLQSMLLAPGTYVLEVRAALNGTNGGSYAGVINVAPPPAVPVPAALPLLLSGMGFLGAALRRRRGRVD